MGELSRIFGGVSLATLLACGGGGNAERMGARAPLQTADNGEQRYAGDPVGPPCMEGLPEADVPRDELSPAMRRALLLAEESLDWPPPAEPATRSSADLETWGEETLTPWIEEKTARAAAARDELNRAATESMRERIMAGAVLGVVYEDVARVLVGLPMPSELETEPEIKATYRDVMVSNAAPYLGNASSAYKACAGNAKQVPELRYWARFCTHRRETLLGETSEVASGTTVVTVEPE